jgi:hypothetical protein
MRQQGMSLPTLAMHVPGFLRSPQVQWKYQVIQVEFVQDDPNFHSD